MDGLLAHEAWFRLAAFAAVFAAMAAWEIRAPRRDPELARGARWPANLGLLVVDGLLVRLLIPTAAVGIALLGEARGWGLLNNLDLPYWLAFVIALLVLDLAIYLQHVLFHAVPALWRLHRVHHTDMDFDLTTALRFHPVEILLSMVIKMAVVAALGAPALAVMLFEVILNGMAMFNHGNVYLPWTWDRRLRRVVVTPDMHRVHHSVHWRETNSNFGFNLSLWDRLFGTYRAQPADGHTGMVIGLDAYRDPRQLGLGGLLVQPFRGGAGGGRLDPS
ncbi:MAG: sterol desaturase family protein [Gammaproteobacteria bacterium]|nr:sterol desaturase family protein [Gammaproteobacteria bacterium]